jgi:hypothetical protein
MPIVGSLKTEIMKRSRKAKLDHFYRLYDCGKIIDVGVSGKAKIETENLFLETFQLDDSLYTGLGVQDLTELSRIHKKKKLVTYPGGIFPFGDNEFSWAFSNAVIEHVGDSDQQLLFINEMLRVAENVFFTTPNKFFPVESHTNAILIHWSSGNLFYDWCKKNKPYWNRDNLNLLSHSDLRDLMVRSDAVEFEILSNRTLGWPMTYTIVCHN